MFKKTLCINLLFLSIIGTAQVMWQFKKDTIITWNYFDGDEFNGDKVDTEFWDYTSGGSHTIFNNLEQQYYTNGNNHVINNGTLKLIAKKEAINGKVIDWMGDNDSMISGKKFYTLNKKNFEYTSGMLNAKKTYNRGYFECRFKITKDKGYWPAFWLHGGDPNEEIDMMECKSERESQIHIDTHCPNRCDDIKYFFQKRSYGGWVKTKHNFTNEYTIVGCDWDENCVKFYVDGECIGVSNVSFNVEKYLTVNLAIPSNNGPFNPAPDKNNTAESVFEIDYVRTWSKAIDFKAKQTFNQTTIINTGIETKKKLLHKSFTKTKTKFIYGYKSDHIKQEAFISYFNNKNYIQITTLGVFTKEKPTYKIISKDNKEILSGVIGNQILNIEKTNLTKGDYILIVSYNNKLAQQAFRNE